MIVTRGLGLPASTLVAAGLGLTAAPSPPVTVPYEERRPRRHPTQKPDLGYDPALYGQLLREDNELLELVTTLVTRILR